LQRWALHVDGLTGGKATNIVGFSSLGMIRSSQLMWR
jgi:hypothetical protein